MVVYVIITLRPRQNGRHFPDDMFKWIFLNEIVWISINISLKFVSRGPINNIPTLVQVMAWRRPGDKPLSEPMMVRLPTHICDTIHSHHRHGIPNNLQLNCAFNMLFTQTTKKNIKVPHKRPFCAGHSPVTDGFAAQNARKQRFHIMTSHFSRVG